VFHHFGGKTSFRKPQTHNLNQIPVIGEIWGMRSLRGNCIPDLAKQVGLRPGGLIVRHNFSDKSNPWIWNG
jgi:hypothetical protein